MQCVSHWNSDHSECHHASLCHRSGQGHDFRVRDDLSLTSLDAAGLERVRSHIKEALRREPYQNVITDGNSNINEALHIQLSLQGASNFKSGNNYVYAEIRRHQACLTWNRGFLRTWKLVLSFLFRDREIFSDVGWDNMQAIDREIASDRKSQEKQESNKKEIRKRTADENASRPRPYDACVYTNLIPYGEAANAMPSVVNNTGVRAM